MGQSGSPADLQVTFLGDGWQPPEQVAGELTDFFAAATRSLDIAIYDCALTGSLADEVRQALQAASRRGVTVRIGYYAGPHQGLAPPPQPEGSQAFVDSVGLPAEPISGFQVLMHHKYVIRDAGLPQAAVWTGSTNWTADSWQREENVILRVPSAPLAALYGADFEDLWRAGNVDNSGARDGGSVTLSYGGQPIAAQVWFSPGQGEDMAHAVADAVSSAQSRILLSTPVLTDGSILGALRRVVEAGRVPVQGVYDRTQMQQALQQWNEADPPSWKIEAFQEVAQRAGFASKVSTPYAPGSVHDYLHAKLIVADDAVFAGSYNFSRSGEGNAENLLRMDCPPLAELCASYIGRLIERYGGTDQRSDGGNVTTDTLPGDSSQT